MTTQRQEKLFRRKLLYFLSVVVTYLFCFLVLAVLFDAVGMVFDLHPYFILFIDAVMMAGIVPLVGYIVDRKLTAVYAPPKDSD